MTSGRKLLAFHPYRAANPRALRGRSSGPGRAARAPGGTNVAWLRPGGVDSASQTKAACPRPLESVVVGRAGQEGEHNSMCLVSINCFCIV